MARHEQLPPAAPHIQQVLHLGKGVHLQESSRFATGKVSHGPVEHLPTLWVGLIPLKDRLAVAMAEGILSSAHAVQQVIPAQVVLIPQHPREVAQGFRMIAPQQLRQGGEAEVPWPGFAEDPQAGQAPQQAKESIGISTAVLRQRVHIPFSGGQGISQTQLRGHMDHLGDPRRHWPEPSAGRTVQAQSHISNLTGPALANQPDGVSLSSGNQQDSFWESCCKECAMDFRRCKREHQMKK